MKKIILLSCAFLSAFISTAQYQKMKAVVFPNSDIVPIQKSKKTRAQDYRILENVNTFTDYQGGTVQLDSFVYTYAANEGAHAVPAINNFPVVGMPAYYKIDACGEIIQWQSYAPPFGSIPNPNYKYLRQFDANNKILNLTTLEVKAGNNTQYLNSKKEIYQYNAQQKLAKTIFQDWDFTLSQWQTIKEQTKTYDAAGNIIKDSTLLVNSNGTKVPSIISSSVYANNKLIKKDIQSLWNSTLQQFNNGNLDSIVYASDSIFIYKFIKFSAIPFQLYNVYLYTFQNGLNKKSFMQNYNTANGSFELNATTDYTYNSNNLLSKVQVRNDSNKLVYNYNLLYDQDGNPVRETIVDSNSVSKLVRNYLYHSSGQYESIVDSFFENGNYGLSSINTDTYKYGIYENGIPLEISAIKDIKLEIFPNPASSWLHISYEIPTASNVEISIFNLLGQPISNSSTYKNKGNYLETIDTRNLAEGMYCVQVKMGNSSTQKVIKVQP